jgi:hypothetical protein
MSNMSLDRVEVTICCANIAAIYIIGDYVHMNDAFDGTTVFM